MKIGIISVLLGDLSTADAMKYLAEAGAECVEIGCGGYPGNAHCKPEILLHDEKAFEEFKKAVYGNGLEISALSCHGNPVHPNKEIAKKYHDDFINTILMCEKLGVDTIIGFSGCPGDCPDSKYPNWVTCAWPDDYPAILEWQWNEVLIPYWKKTAAFAAEHGIKKIAFEMHPGFCVYNPETLLKLRNAVGPIIGANLDPSHLVWQGIDVPEAIRYLGEAVSQPLVGVQDARLRQRLHILEGHRQHAPHGRLRRRDLDRARGRSDEPEGGSQKGDRVPEGSAREGARGRDVLGVKRESLFIPDVRNAENNGK